MRLFSPSIVLFRGKKKHYSQNSRGRFIPYNALLGVEKDDIGPENTRFEGIIPADRLAIFHLPGVEAEAVNRLVRVLD